MAHAAEPYTDPDTPTHSEILARALPDNDKIIRSRARLISMYYVHTKIIHCRLCHQFIFNAINFFLRFNV